jgi:uncharacterized protein DUF3604
MKLCILRACAALLLLLSLNAQARDSEYLPTDLRSRVDQLKADLKTIPTTNTNAKARARLTWQWLNAYALDGGYIPVNATQVIAFVLGAPKVTENMINALNATISEFAFLDDNPDALGTLTTDLGPFTAGGVGTIRQTYTVGKKPIQAGGGLLVARHFMANFGAWQTNDPTASNYLSVESNNPRVSFVATTAPMTGMHGGFRSSRPTLGFEVASGTLTEGDTITITYGDTRSGSPGMDLPSFSSDRMPLPLYVAFEDASPYLSLPIAPVQITGASLAGVAGFVPSVVKPGETFTLAIRARDRFYNRASGDLPDWQVLKDGQPWLNVPAQGPISLVETSIAEPGAHYLTIRSSDDSVQGAINPILVSIEDRNRIYWGDTHGHSGFAEGIGTPEGFMRWARDDARLDYVTHSEHDIWLDDAEWEILRDNVRKFTKEGEFIAYLGYEWTVNNIRGGHHNVLFRNPEQRNRIPAQFYPTLASLYQGLRNTASIHDVVVIPHAHQAGDYRFSDPALEPLVEIMSQHGNFEWFGRMYLQHGHQVGFTAASDNHLSQPGYSAPLGGSLSQRGGLGAILAPARTTDALFDGMKALQAYATTGDRIIVDFEVNGAGMGARAQFAEDRKIEGRVIGTAPIDSITVFKNDQVIWQNAYLDNQEERLSKEDTFLLSFSSDSTPFHPGDNPRGWRGWEGTLEVLGGKLVTIEPVDASFPLQRVDVSDENPNRVTFSTKTRGDSSSYLIRLQDISRTTRLKIDLVETRETGGAPPVYRPPQRVPADSYVLALRDMQNGQIAHSQNTDGYLDRSLLRRIVTDGKREVTFEINDRSNKQGDYYFMRVTQANDALAWSSPVWVGGFPSQ